jgi:7,8-dihydropterin-6-yl-methyl-4-(beta-D-ribofuranosyl)aminobenzene 5'-phosphate synthase
LSLFIQYSSGSILFDTGSSGAFLPNAVKLGINCQDVSHVVISHHHYDHGGGLAVFLAANLHARINLRQNDTEDYYFKPFWFVSRYVGLDTRVYEQYPTRFTFISQFAEIAPGVFILTKIPRAHPIPKGNRYIYTKKNGRYQLDTFDHELVLVIKELDRLVVFTGCSHSGILNMVEAVTQHFPYLPIKAVLGGFHMIGLPFTNNMAENVQSVKNIGNQLLKFPIEKIYTGHCTGKKAFGVLKRVLGEKLYSL